MYGRGKNLPDLWIAVKPFVKSRLLTFMFSRLCKLSSKTRIAFENQRTSFTLNHFIDENISRLTCSKKSYI